MSSVSSKQLHKGEKMHSLIIKSTMAFDKSAKVRLISCLLVPLLVSLGIAFLRIIIKQAE